MTSTLFSYATMAEQLKAGTLRALATVTRMRIEVLPDVPTVAESGYKGYEIDYWNGLFAPAVNQAASWETVCFGVFAAVQAPEIKAKLVVLGLFPVGMCGADFAALVRKQYAEYGKAIREANIKAE
jgi:tripartite-type tricarboxylate transporter receptor subunit TctC